MRRPWFPALLPLVALALVAVGCGGDGDEQGTDDPATTGASAAAERVELEGTSALVWGDGPRGALLAHGAAFDAASWQDQADQIAALGFTVLAVEDTGHDGLLAGDAYLRDDAGVSDVAFIGGSAGADSMLSLLSQQPDLADQVILLSPNRVVEAPGTQPKLFIASEDEAVTDVSTELADSLPGEQNEALIVPGSAHAQNMFASDQADMVIGAILERLDSPS